MMNSKKVLIAADSGFCASQQSEDDDDELHSASLSDVQAEDNLALRNGLDQHQSRKSSRLLGSVLPNHLPVSLDTSDMKSWNVHTIKQWLTSNGFADFGSILCDDHKIDGSVLLSMTEEDLLLPLLNLRVFGDVRRLSMLLDNVRYPALKLSCLAYLICFYRFEEPT